ncbi:hypothetical protein [uncultured Paraglaciecola sp.]|uniref:hypothetical protein n=1 Tax=uncultured Paraglaciecola sp. TaxID=1765024 RepID=UPI00261A4C21|nr:hypothetical protein [uncultured Paraglaciecola sp.]
MSSNRFAFASSLWSCVPGILVVVFFAISDIDLYKSVSKANQGYEFLFFIAPIILVLLMLYHTVIGFIQNNLERPKILLTIIASILAALPFPVLLAFSKPDAASEDRVAIFLTAAIIFAIFWLSIFVGSCFQFFKIRDGVTSGT